MFRLAIRGFLICTLTFLAAFSATGNTIIKLDLGGVGPDIGMNANGELSTVDDGDASTAGDQDTDVEYTGAFGSLADINTPPASFTLNGLTAAGPAEVLGTLAIQNFVGGQFNLYDPANNLLLSGPLTTSTLTGVIGPPATGALFTTTLATATGGSLASLVLPGTLSLSMNLTNINGGSGFSTSDGILLPFLADASVNFAADGARVPEPSTLALLTLGSLGLLARRRFARSAIHR